MILPTFHIQFYFIKEIRLISKDESKRQSGDANCRHYDYDIDILKHLIIKYDSKKILVDDIANIKYSQFCFIKEKQFLTIISRGTMVIEPGMTLLPWERGYTCIFLIHGFASFEVR